MIGLGATVTGRPADIRAINYKFGDRSQVLSEHRNEIVLGNDATGEWQKDSVFGDIDRLAMGGPRLAALLLRCVPGGEVEKRLN